MRSRYKVYTESGVYFITSSVMDWVSILMNDKISSIIIECFKFCQKEKQLFIYGYVIMLNHFHMIIGVEEPEKIPSVVR